MSRLLVARSCAPPADEWPVSPSGSRVTREPANSSGVHDQRSTGMLTTVTTAANSAVHRHAPAMSMSPATDHTSAGLNREVSGCPLTSETVNGTISAAHTVQIPAAAVPTRSARYPATSSTPVFCGGTMNAANRKEPVAVTAAISPAACTNGSP